MKAKSKKKNIFDFRYREEAVPGSSKFEHYHDTYELTFFRKANCTLFLRDTRFDIQDGDFLLIDPYEVHRLSFNSSSYARYIFYFKKKFLSELLEALQLNEILQDQRNGTRKKIASTNLKQRMELEQICRNVMKSWKECSEMEESDWAESKIKIYLSLLLIRYAEMIKEQHQQDLKLSVKEEQVKEIINFIDRHFKESISLQTLEDRFHLSRYYISHIFKEVSQFSVIEYLHHRRIIEAQKLLQYSNESINDICFECGFSSTQHFHSIFKKVTGTTPYKFKKGE